MLESLLTPLGTQQMAAGLLAGFVAFVIVLALAGVSLRATRIAGLALVLSAVVGLVQAGLDELPPPWVGLGLLGVAGLLRLTSRLGWLWWVPAASGLLMLTERLGTPASGWRVLVTLLGLGVAAAVMRFDEDSPQAPLGTALLLGTAGGIYATVPDTEQALVLLGAALPLGLLGWPLRWGRLGTIAAPAAAGLLVWVVATGGFGRDGAVIGGLACAGLLICDPIARLIAGRSLLDGIPTHWNSGLVVVAGQILVALLASRVAGLRESALGAGLIAVALLIAVTMLLARSTWVAKRR